MTTPKTKQSFAATLDPEEARLAAIRERAKHCFGEWLLTQGSTNLLMSVAATRKALGELNGRPREDMDDAIDAELARRRGRFN